MSAGLGREDIRALLDDLSAELAVRGARAELFLVGGAALAVAYDATRSTRDLDAVFIPSEVVRQAAAAVAEREGLAEDWLNDAVKGFLPGPDPDAQRFYSSDSLIVDVASPRYLLAMKLFAARAEIDAEDIILLYRQLGFSHSGRRSRLTNAPAPPPPPLPGADRSDMEYYITQAKIVLPVLGINLLRASAVSPAGSAGIAPGSRPRHRQLALSPSRRMESLPRRGKSTVSSPPSKGRMRGSRGSAHRMRIRRCTSRS